MYGKRSLVPGKGRKPRASLWENQEQKLIRQAKEQSEKARREKEEREVRMRAVADKKAQEMIQEDERKEAENQLKSRGSSLSEDEWKNLILKRAKGGKSRRRINRKGNKGRKKFTKRRKATKKRRVRKARKTTRRSGGMRNPFRRIELRKEKLTKEEGVFTRDEANTFFTRLKEYFELMPPYQYMRMLNTYILGSRGFIPTKESEQFQTEMIEYMMGNRKEDPGGHTFWFDAGMMNVPGTNEGIDKHMGLGSIKFLRLVFDRLSGKQSQEFYSADRALPTLWKPRLSRYDGDEEGELIKGWAPSDYGGIQRTREQHREFLINNFS